MIGLIIGAVLLLVFGILAFLASKTWKAGHIVLLVFVFLMALVFTAFSTAALKTRAAWKKKHDGLISQIETKIRDLDRLKYGDPNDEESRSIPQLQNALRKTTLDRGRVWRGVLPGPMAEEAKILSLANWGGDNCFKLGDEEEPMAVPDEEGAEGEAAPAAASGKPHGIEEGMVLYGFLEYPAKLANESQRAALFGDSQMLENDARNACRIPSFYLGNFRVSGVEGPAIQVKPVLPPDAEQLNAINAGEGTWVLYESMPVDKHEILAGLGEEQLAGIFPTDNAGRIIQEYAADLQPADGGADPVRTMQKVKFLRDYEIDVDVDSGEEGLENFDPTGRALAADLRQGEPTSFKEGDIPEVPFDSVTAERLRADGIVEFVEEAPIYVRRLRDYAAMYSQDARELQALEREIEMLKTDNDAIAATAEKARAQIAYREQEIEKLGVDSKQLTAELEMLSKYRKDLKRKFEDQRWSLSSLYNMNHQLANGLRGFIFAGAGN